MTDKLVADSGTKNLNKAKMQISWDKITIDAVPATGRCKGEGMLKQRKTIIDGVSGTVQPGQFLAIIGASGKNFDRLTFLRCW